MEKKPTKTTIALHWIISTSIIVMITVGYIMKEFKIYKIYPIHKSVGTILAALILFRIAYRFKKGFLKTEKKAKKHEILLKKINQICLLIASALMPITGIMMSVASGRGLYVFDYQIIKKGAYKAAELGKTANNLHTIISYIFIGLILLHVIGALKHHFIYKDNTLKRMIKN